MISVYPRDSFGTLKSKAIRKEGLVPCSIYSKEGNVIHISVSNKEFSKLIENYKFLNTKLELSLDGKKFCVLPKSIDFHPVNEKILHIEFKEVPANDLVEVLVPVEILNRAKSVGIKTGGKLNIGSHNLLVSCKSDKIPEKISIDIEKFGIGRTLFTNSLPKNSDYSFVNNSFILSILGRGRKDKGEVAE